MSLRIDNSDESLYVKRNSSNAKNKISESPNRSSANNSAKTEKDDDSGFAITKQLKPKVPMMQEAYQHINATNSMLQIFEDSYSKINNILLKMKDIATKVLKNFNIDNLEGDEQTLEANLQTSSETVSVQGMGTLRSYESTSINFQLTKEILQWRDEINDISANTRFNDRNIVQQQESINEETNEVSENQDSSDKQQVMFFLPSGNKIKTEINVKLEFNIVSTQNLGLDNLGFEDVSKAQASLEKIEKALNKISDTVSQFGEYQKYMAEVIKTLKVNTQTESFVQNADRVFELATSTSNLILENMQLAITAQANQAPQQIKQLLGG